MPLPQDPIMLLSYVNTQLRDKYSSLERLCDDLDEDIVILQEKLALLDYHYDPSSNRFI